jgi:hypothetical protein
MPLTFDSDNAILVGAILLVIAAVWYLLRSRVAIPVMGSILLYLGLALVVVPTGGKVRDLIEDGRFYMREMYELRTDQFTRELLTDAKYQDPRKLNRYEAKIYSQGGEDGILIEIFRRVGVTNKYFAELGASDGVENNTVYLLSEGWRGFWIDGDVEAVQRANRSFADHVTNGRLVIEAAFITAENIESLFAKASVPPEFDLLSIDIDRNDYYVWEKIREYRPRVVVVEYNGIFPAGVRWIVPYDANAWWDGTSRFGASLTALELLGREKGYELVGCSLSGANAFFVRKELVTDEFLGPYTAAVHYEPPRYFLAYRVGGHARKP